MTDITTIQGQQIKFSTAYASMDSDIRIYLRKLVYLSGINSGRKPGEEQRFYDAYAAAHRAKFGSDFVVSA